MTLPFIIQACTLKFKSLYSTDALLNVAPHTIKTENILCRYTSEKSSVTLAIQQFSLHPLQKIGLIGFSQYYFSIDIF